MMRTEQYRPMRLIFGNGLGARGCAPGRCEILNPVESMFKGWSQDSEGKPVPSL